MKMLWRLFLLTAVALALVAGSFAQSSLPPSAAKLSSLQAVTTLRHSLLEVDRSYRQNHSFSDFFKDLEPLQDIEVDLRSFSYLDRGKYSSFAGWTEFSAKRTFAYRDLTYVSVGKKCYGMWCLVPQITSEKTDPKLTWKTEEPAQRFADALNRLIYNSSPDKIAADKKELEDFPALAAAWQKGGATETLPEEVRRLKTLAENYIQAKEFDQAIQKYEAGLAIYPTWPTGHFNIALLYGELGQYSDAVKHMTEYLLLVPNAPDAGPARDKVDFWRDKARN